MLDEAVPLLSILISTKKVSTGVAGLLRSKKALAS